MRHVACTHRAGQSPPDRAGRRGNVEPRARTGRQNTPKKPPSVSKEDQPVLPAERASRPSILQVGIASATHRVGCVIPHDGQYYLVPAKAHPYDAVLRDCFGKLKAERVFNLVRGLGWQWDLRGESSCLEGDADGDADDDWDRCPAFGSWA